MNDHTPPHPPSRNTNAVVMIADKAYFPSALYLYSILKRQGFAFDPIIVSVDHHP